MQEKIIILDFGSQYTQLIARTALIHQSAASCSQPPSG